MTIHWLLNTLELLTVQDYTDWFNTDYSFNDQLDIWEFKYLGKEPTDPKKKQLIEKYLEEFPDNPI